MYDISELITVSEKPVFECMNGPNCVELEHQSGFYNVNVKWTIMLNGSIIFKPLKTKKK